MTQEQILSDLQEDSHYYGKLGGHYLSNSVIGTLLNNPKSFGKKQEETLPMIQGRYFHTAMLEPKKLVNFKIVDASTRSTNRYKEVSGNDLLLLQKEVDQLDKIVDVMKGNKEMHDNIYANGNIYELPAIGVLEGLEWKGKADIVTETKLIDIKTTSDIGKFRYSAYKYNYDSQAYIYYQLFGKLMEFYVIDKTTFDMGIFTCSDDFLESGRDKVKKAVDIYTKFFGDNPTEDINQYLFRAEL